MSEKYLLLFKDNELGKLNLNKTYRFNTAEEAKAWCEHYYSSLGEAKFYEDEEYITFTRELCASDYLGIIQKP